MSILFGQHARLNRFLNSKITAFLHPWQFVSYKIIRSSWKTCTGETARHKKQAEPAKAIIIDTVES